MARSVDPKAHAVRREAFLAATESLLSTKGFEEVSVQDVLTATGASKGAFYHYFASKQDLLEALAERLADTLSRGMRETAEARGLSAPERLNRMFAALGTTKLERRDMIVAMLRVWFSDANAAVRQRVRRCVSDRITPLLADVIAQGRREGSFDAEPVHGRILAGLVQDHNDEVGQRILSAEARGESGGALLEEVRALAVIYTSVIERILGAPPGTICLVDFDVLDTWIRSGSDT
jgi:AcrR family transcriptional regulator